MPYKELGALCSLVTFLAMAPDTAAQDPAGGALDGERHRVIVSSDIGGSDNDDYQSMVHFLMYADVFDVEGLISSPPQAGRATHIHEVIAAYEKDFPNLSRHSPKYPEPEHLRSLVKQGAIDPAPEAGFAEATEGSNWLIERAGAEDARPLYILVWGSITDVAEAVHDAPDIKENLRVYSIASWNTRMDQAARDYLYNHHPDLWWVEADTTFRGMYVGGNQKDDLHNKTFLERHVAGHGALGNLLVKKLDAIKMGDTPSVLYLLSGDAADPTGQHWGGSFIATDHGPHYWTDSKDPALTEGRYPGAKTVNVWRKAYLRDWETRMNWALPEEK
jgi:Cellulose-binding Sde182, nucleoside hydrolase-like domain